MEKLIEKYENAKKCNGTVYGAYNRASIYLDGEKIELSEVEVFELFMHILETRGERIAGRNGKTLREFIEKSKKDFIETSASRTTRIFKDNNMYDVVEEVALYYSK